MSLAAVMIFVGPVVLAAISAGSAGIMAARQGPARTPDRTRAGPVSLKTVIDRSFGGLLAVLGSKIAAT